MYVTAVCEAWSLLWFIEYSGEEFSRNRRANPKWANVEVRGDKRWTCLMELFSDLSQNPFWNARNFIYLLFKMRLGSPLWSCSVWKQSLTLQNHCLSWRMGFFLLHLLVLYYINISRNVCNRRSVQIQSSKKKAYPIPDTCFKTFPLLCSCGLGMSVVQL